MSRKGDKMKELMQAIAQTLQNLGFSDAEAGHYSVKVRGCEFLAIYSHGSFMFCGRRYKSGNTLTATIDLIQELPLRLRQLEEAKIEKSKILVAEKLTKSLDDPCMKVTYNHCKRKFIFTYTCSDLDTISTITQRIAAELAAASEQAWNEIVLESKTNKTFAKFTAEGGFSLN